MNEKKTFIERVVNSIKLAVASLPAIYVGGHALQGLSKTVANPTAAKVLFQTGSAVSKYSGLAMKSIASATKTAVVRTVPVVSSVARTLPMSKYFGTAMKVAKPVSVALVWTDLYHMTKDTLSLLKGDLNSEQKKTLQNNVPIVGQEGFFKKLFGMFTLRYTRKRKEGGF